mmetsp:Transcript_99011/g.176404  ORF Transcript_99011/g.176404 Transcript_99011/m.176404 type:complete len:125 (-) Transcript_99011:17-391(-)
MVVLEDHDVYMEAVLLPLLGRWHHGQLRCPGFESRPSSLCGIPKTQVDDDLLPLRYSAIGPHLSISQRTLLVLKATLQLAGRELAWYTLQVAAGVCNMYLVFGKREAEMQCPLPKMHCGDGRSD